MSAQGADTDLVVCACGGPREGYLGLAHPRPADLIYRGGSDWQCPRCFVIVHPAPEVGRAPAEPAPGVPVSARVGKPYDAQPEEAYHGPRRKGYRMTPARLASLASLLYTARSWQSELARNLTQPATGRNGRRSPSRAPGEPGVSVRLVRRWLSGARAPIPAWVEGELFRLLREKHQAIGRVIAAHELDISS